MKSHRLLWFRDTVYPRYLDLFKIHPPQPPKCQDSGHVPELSHRLWEGTVLYGHIRVRPLSSILSKQEYYHPQQTYLLKPSVLSTKASICFLCVPAALPCPALSVWCCVESRMAFTGVSAEVTEQCRMWPERMATGTVWQMIYGMKRDKDGQSG